MEKNTDNGIQRGFSFDEIQCTGTDFDIHMSERIEKEISAQEIEGLIDGGIAFTKNRLLVFDECEQMEYWEGCIALRDIIGNPPYFAFFYPSQKQRLRIVFDNENAFHKLYMHIEASGYHSFDLS